MSRDSNKKQPIKDIRTCHHCRYHMYGHAKYMKEKLVLSLKDRACEFGILFNHIINYLENSNI
jgi:hypothetical protein